MRKLPKVAQSPENEDKTNNIGIPHLRFFRKRRILCDNFRMMENVALFERLQSAAEAWRADGWPCEKAPLIAEIMRWQFAGDPKNDTLKFLRWPQFRALEVYWMLRLKHGTPHIMDLYREIYADDLSGFGKALGAPLPPSVADLIDFERIEEKIRKDDDFVRKYKFDALREAADLPYPSYIFALTMGAGKTILISAIIATEFAMALRQPEDDEQFMRNALIFAPGKTILASLREISAAPYQDILPPESYQQFNINAKIVYPRDGDPEIHVASGGAYNIIVTNTEKIRLQANINGKKKNILALKRDGERKQLEANLRLQKIKSLPNLGIFSDEAHHTYGDQVGKSIKRVRETVNYIAKQTKVVAVVNTTGTPYHKKNQMLAEVVSWYGIKQGIEDNILKGFNTRNYDMSEANGDKKHLPDIVRHFFDNYGDVVLPDGAPAKIAFFFKRIEHLRECQEIIANEMEVIGQDISQILVNTQKSDIKAKEEFASLNSPDSRKRVILLVGIGTEGWDCPSLFATALVKGKTSGIFALQAATRCLRQVEGNTRPAHMYLHVANAKILDTEMEKTFGVSLGRLAGIEASSRSVTVRIRKVDKLPKLNIVHERIRIVRTLPPKKNIRLSRPSPNKAPRITVTTLVPDMSSPNLIFAQIGGTETLRERPAATNPHAAAAQLAANYHLPATPLLKQLQALYPQGEIPEGELRLLAGQVEQQTSCYEEELERVPEVMALIRVMDDSNRPLFQQDDKGEFYHTLRYKESTYQRMSANGLFVELAGDAQTPDAITIADKQDVSFHYAPYNFDSKPEREFFMKILAELNLTPRDIQCFVFTGGLTGAAQTDFFFEYKGDDGRFHRYHPDFVIVRKNREFLVVEMKDEEERETAEVKAKKRAILRLKDIQPNKIGYEIVYTRDASVSDKAFKPVRKWINSHEKK